MTVAEHKLVGANYTLPDLVAKVTGKAKYAEDWKAEGMLFAKLLLSPMPHARVTRIDASAALAMPGVKAILTADDLPGAQAGTTPGQNVVPTVPGERPLTMEPVYEGKPILAVAAVGELTAANAIEQIHIEFEPLPFSVDPVESLRPGSPNARLQGNTWVRPAAPPPAPAAAPSAGGATPAAAPPAAPPAPVVQELKWTAEDFAAAPAGQLPWGKGTEDWSYGGDVDAIMKTADLVLDETFVTQSVSHQPLETRTAMAYWENGKLYVYCSTQSTVQTMATVARGVGIPNNEAQDKIVLISEYTGGGFGSKIPGSINIAIPALLAKKANAPVQLRISREEEHYIGRARPGVHARVKVGLRKDGKILAIDGIAVGENGPYEQQGDAGSAGRTISLAYQPTAMRWRSLSVLTN